MILPLYLLTTVSILRSLYVLVVICIYVRERVFPVERL